MPSSEEYWHIGETKIRLGNVTERSCNGEKRWDIAWDSRRGSRAFYNPAMKISPEYLEQNRRLHETGHYGISGTRWAKTVANVCAVAGSRDVLDYGCGQCTLEKDLGWPIRNYDPCIPGLDAPPEPADVVVCTDVLEHVEEDCLDEVLDDLQRVTRRIGFLVIATRPADKILPDGRNAHLIQQAAPWWLPKLERRFAVSQVKPMNGEFAVVVRPLQAPCPS
jgi:hypothetical protein